jgi:tRNA A37 threonylcarbamoyladenosine dehydratase
MMLGREAVSRLSSARVAVFGVGGVGGFTVEALARAGVGELHLFDSDSVSITNINRQIIALHSTVGRPKVEVMRERILDINPAARVEVFHIFYGEDTADEIDLAQYDYVVDAIDSVRSKILLITRAKSAGVPIISSMGAGNKLDPTGFEVADIYKTSVCPLARAIRSELKRRGVDSLKVVYSKEPPVLVGERTPGSISFVPSVVGLILAGEVIKDIAKTN